MSDIRHCPLSKRTQLSSPLHRNCHMRNSVSHSWKTHSGKHAILQVGRLRAPERNQIRNTHGRRAEAMMNIRQLGRKLGRETQPRAFGRLPKSSGRLVRSLWSWSNNSLTTFNRRWTDADWGWTSRSPRLIRMWALENMPHSVILYTV